MLLLSLNGTTWIDTAVAAILLSLRLAPALGMAQPFTLIRVPVVLRVLLALALALWLVDARPAATVARVPGRAVAGLMLGELSVGLSIALALQLAFAAVAWAGRVIDVQVGFGLAALADPTTREELPLAGTVLVYGGGMIFFATGAHFDLVALWAASVDALPLGFGVLRPDLVALGAFIGTVFALAVGLVGASLLAIFLTDLSIALMARTLPQMNVLLLGFQVKAMLLLVTLPIALSVSASLFLRIFTLSVAAPAGWWGHR